MVDMQPLEELQWFQEAPALHALVATQVSARLEQLYRQEDRLWIKQEASKAALAVIEKLNACLEKACSLSSYQDLHQELLMLLREIKLDQLLSAKIIECFGADCIFMQHITQAMSL